MSLNRQWIDHSSSLNMKYTWARLREGGGWSYTTSDWTMRLAEKVPHLAIGCGWAPWASIRSALSLIEICHLAQPEKKQIDRTINSAIFKNGIAIRQSPPSVISIITLPSAIFEFPYCAGRAGGSFPVMEMMIREIGHTLLHHVNLNGLNTDEFLTYRFLMRVLDVLMEKKISSWKQLHSCNPSCSLRFVLISFILFSFNVHSNGTASRCVFGVQSHWIKVVTSQPIRAFPKAFFVQWISPWKSLFEEIYGQRWIVGIANKFSISHNHCA